MASPSPSSMASDTIPPQYRPVGITLAVGSGVLIGSSFVFKKKGLLRSQAGHEAGEGVAYLKSPLWWTGMIIMILGELCNFGAYAFVEAILVTPLGALSVVICAILSHFFLKERLTLFGWIGCTQCILGAIIIALNGPEEQSVTTIAAFKHMFLAPGFLSYGAVIIAASLVIIFFIGPKYGKKNMIWYILVCSLIGGLSVSCTQALGACIITSIRGNNQFKNWFIYFLLAFVVVTLVTEIYYLNMALALFNTAMVTPTYYVLFTFSTLVTSVILYQGLKASGAQIMTIVLAFFVICTGISILQMSKVDPRKLSNLDRKTTILLEAARQEVSAEPEDEDGSGSPGVLDPEKRALGKSEEPGIDTFSPGGTIVGTFVRARKRTLTRRESSLSARSNGQSSTDGGQLGVHGEPTMHQLLSAGSLPAAIGHTSSIQYGNGSPLSDTGKKRTKTSTSLPVNVMHGLAYTPPTTPAAVRPTATTKISDGSRAGGTMSPVIPVSESPTQLTPTSNGNDERSGYLSLSSPRRPSFATSIASVPEEDEGLASHAGPGEKGNMEDPVDEKDSERDTLGRRKADTQ